VFGLPSLTFVLAALLAPVLSIPWLANLLRLGCAFLLLLVPSTAMGATLPVMVSALYRRDPRFGSVLGRLYGWNTLGAVVGALVGHAVLVKALGVRGTGFAAAGLSLSVAMLALALSNRVESKDRAVDRPESPAAISRRAWGLGGAGLDWILLGTRDAQGPGSVERFARQWLDPVVGPEFVALGVELPEQLGAMFMGDADTFETS
jgi:hypothetical protein